MFNANKNIVAYIAVKEKFTVQKSQDLGLTGKEQLVDVVDTVIR